MKRSKLTILCVACCCSLFDLGFYPAFGQDGKAPAGEVKKGISSAIVLLLLNGAEPVQPFCGAIANGDFESANTVWTEYSSHGWNLITTSFPGEVAPHSGSHAVWLGGDYDDVSYIEQQIPVYLPCSVLTFYHWIASQDICGFDEGSVRINGTVVRTYQLCEIRNTSGWVVDSIDLSAYAGQTVTLQIRTETDGSLNSNLFIDDVSFLAAP